MLSLILTIIAGIIFGKLISAKNLTFNWANAIFITVLILLFVMGIGIGSNPRIINNLSSLGLEALIITSGAVGGSLLASFILWKIIKKRSL